MSFRYLAASLSLLAFVGACSDDEAELRWDPKRSTIAISRSDVLPADGESSFDIDVVVRDSLKAPQANVPLHFEVNNIGVVIEQPGRTDKQGRAHGHVTSTVYGKKTISVWAGEGRDRILLGNRHLEFGAGQAAAIQVLGVPSDLRVGDRFAAHARIVDSSGNQVTSADDLEVRISLVGNDAGATLAGPTVSSPEMGQVTFAGLTITAPGQGLVFEVSAPEMEAVRSQPFQILAADAAAIAIVDAPQDLIAGTPLPALTVLAQDRFGNVLVDQRMTVRLSLEGVGELEGETERRLVDGRAVFEGLTIDRAGEFRLIATADGGLTAATELFLVEEAGAAPIRILTAGTQTVEQQARITVLARDDEGNRRSGMLVELSSDDGALTFKPSRGLTDKDGRFASTVTTTVAGTHNAKAQVGGVDGTLAEADLVFNAGRPSTANSVFMLSGEVLEAGQTATVEVGQTATVDLLIADQFNNAVSDEAFRLDKVGAASMDFTISPDPSFTTNDDGEAQLFISADVVGAASVGLFQGTSNVPLMRRSIVFVEAAGDDDEEEEDEGI